MSKPIRVLALPAFSTRAGNPYNWLLYTAMQRQGAIVEELTANRILGNYDIMHLHWPEHYLNKPGVLQAYLKAPMWQIVLDVVHRKGMKVVWTVHNLRSHEQRRPALEALFWAKFTSRLDGYLALTHSGLSAAQSAFPSLANIPGFIVPHGHYRSEYPSGVSKAEARMRLGCDAHSRVLLFFGSIRPYKNVPKLIRVFRNLTGDVVLIVAGGASDERLRNAVREASDDSRIRLFPEFVPKESVPQFFAAADLVVLPFSEILNSGSAMLSLSLNRPVLVPDRGAMRELRDQVGPEWVRTYNGDISSSCLQSALDWACHTDPAAEAPLQAFEWDAIASQTIDAFSSILNGRSGLHNISVHCKDFSA